MASPLLNFAIIGRKSSGKTCLLTALASPRDANPNGINCDLSRAKERYSEYLNQEVIKDFFKLSNGSIATYDEMLQIIDLHKKELANKHFPSATALSGKSLCIYNFDTKDRVSFDVGLFDYAGELVDAESNLADDLKKVLGKMSALMILVELGETDEKSKTKTALDISNLQQFFKSIEANGDNCSRFNIPIALLITKADKYVTIDYKQYCEDKEYSKLVIERILATEYGSNLRNLMNSIEVCTNEGLFNVFPISSFGNIGKEESVSIPLKSLNILEPFYWAAQSWAKNIITTTDNEISSKGKLSLVLSCLAKDYTKDLNTAVALLPDSCPNKTKGKELVEHLSGVKGLVGIAVMVLAILLCGEFVFDYSHILGIKHRELTLSNAPKKIAWLDDYLDSSIFRHSLAKNICLSTEESAKYLKEISEKYDELFWADVFWDDAMNCSDAKRMESKLEEYKKTFPNGLHSKEATEVAKVILEKKAKDIWVNSLLTLATTDFKKEREAAIAKSCYCNMRVLLGAVEMYNMDNSVMMTQLDIQKLVESKYLYSEPHKPETGCSYYSEGDLTQDGKIKCKLHGAAPELFVESKYLMSVPHKPETGCSYYSEGDLTQDGKIKCKLHGDVPEL